MNQGWTVYDALAQADADYPACGDSNCTRFAGDRDFAVVPVVERDPWPPAVTVTQPAGGEVLEYGTVYEITWEALDNGLIDSVSILLSLDGGFTYPDIIASGEPNDSPYLWDVPDIDSKTARIRVIATDCAMHEGMGSSDSDFTLWGSTSGTERPGSGGIPVALVLEMDGANPVGGGSRIVLGLPVPDEVRLAVYDVSGRHLGDLLHGHLGEGYHAVKWGDRAWRGVRLRPGIYFVRLDSAQGSRTVKAVVAQ
jgi:hypothetical protein